MSSTRSTTPSTASLAGSSTRRETRSNCGNPLPGNERASMTGKKLIAYIGVFGGLLVAVLYLGMEPSNLAALAAGGAISAWRNRRQRAKDSAFWGIVWQLRQANV